MRTSRARGFGRRKHGHWIKWKSEMWREMAGAESPSSAEACAASHLRRLGRKAGAASCRPHCEQLLAETTGSGRPLENKSMVYFHPFCYFCGMAVIMDCALPSSAALGRAACDISQLGMPWLATCLLVKWKKYRWLTFWLRLLSQTAAYASQKTVTYFFSLFSYFYRPENPAASEWLKALS